MSAALLRRNLLLFHLYRFLSTSYLFIPVLYLQFRGLSFTEIGLLSTVYCVTVMLFEVPTGALADHFGRRKAMALGSLMMAGGCLVDYFGRSFIAFAAGDGFLALGMTLTSGADSAYLFDLLRDADKEYHYRRLEGSATAMKLIGTALALLAGGFVAHYDIALTYLLSFFVCTLSAGVAWLLYERPPLRIDRGRKNAWFLPLIRSASSEIIRRPQLRLAIGFSILVFTLLREGMYLYPIYLKQAHFDVAVIGTVLAGLTLVGAWSAHRIDFIRRVVGEWRLLMLLPLLLALTYFAMGRWFTGFGVSLLAVQMLVNGVYSPLSKELLNREIESSHQRATVLSIESMSRRLVFGAATPVVGIFMDHMGVPSGFYVSGFLGLCGLALLYMRRGAARSEHAAAPMPKDARAVVRAGALAEPGPATVREGTGGL